MNHFVHMGIFSLYILKMSFYCIMLAVKASSMIQLFCDCIVYFVFYFALFMTFCYLYLLGAISHTPCVYNGIHMSHVFLQHLLYIYLFIYCVMKTNRFN